MRETKTYWEIKNHIKDVVGNRFGPWGEVYAGWVNVETRDKAVYVGGRPSLGHTYLRLIGGPRPSAPRPAPSTTSHIPPPHRGA